MLFWHSQLFLFIWVPELTRIAFFLANDEPIHRTWFQTIDQQLWERFSSKQYFVFQFWAYPIVNWIFSINKSFSRSNIWKIHFIMDPPMIYIKLFQRIYNNYSYVNYLHQYLFKCLKRSNNKEPSYMELLLHRKIQNKRCNGELL